MTLEASPSGTSNRAIQRLVEAVESVLLGQPRAIRLAVVALLADGHILLEDVPGTGKTTLARCLAEALGLDFGRIQFTADLLPADVLGLSIHEPGEGFRFQPGPIFRDLVLADELNRTPPRTQSALLECMNEGRVSAEGQTHELPRPFFVIATQNPLEFAGTYPLPESQLDRFLVRIQLGYPEGKAEAEILRSRREASEPRLEPVIDRQELLSAMEEVRRVRIHDSILEYLLALLAATRQSRELELGASTRAGLALQRAAQAMAYLEGRDYCVPDDVQRLVVPVLAHRLVPAGSSLEGGSAGASAAVLEDLLETVPVPDIEEAR